jgi:phospholipase C
MKPIADEYTPNDNYHQPMMSGTLIQHIALGTAGVIPWATFQGQRSPGNIANLNPKSSTNPVFQADGAWTNTPNWAPNRQSATRASGCRRLDDASRGFQQIAAPPSQTYSLFFRLLA